MPGNDDRHFGLQEGEGRTCGSLLVGACTRNWVFVVAGTHFAAAGTHFVVVGAAAGKLGVAGTHFAVPTDT